MIHARALAWEQESVWRVIVSVHEHSSVHRLEAVSSSQERVALHHSLQKALFPDISE